MTPTFEDYLLLILITGGTLFILLAAVGILRMPDLYLRISVTTKALTLGVGLILLGVATHFSTVSVTTRILAIILFLILTSPISAHLMGKASYLVGIPMWKKSVLDELKEAKESDHKYGVHSESNRPEGVIPHVEDESDASPDQARDESDRED